MRADLLEDKEGFETVLGLVSSALTPPSSRKRLTPWRSRSAAADLAVGREELRFLAILRDHLGLDKLVTAAIERSAIARYQSLA